MKGKFRRWFSCFTLLSFAPVCSANWITETVNWIETKYQEARKDIAKLEHQAEASALYVGKKSAEEFNVIAADAVKEMTHAADEILKALENWDDFGGQCEDLVATSGKAFFDSYPKPQYAGLPTGLQFMEGNQCTANQISGFSCGIFPYIRTIATAISEGEGKIDQFSAALGKSYYSKQCSRLPLSEQPFCAITMAAMKESQKGMSCLANVVSQVASESNGNATLTEKQRDQICTMSGEFVFSVAADTSLGGVIPDQAKRLKLLYSIVTKLRTALALTHMAEKKVDELCHSGIKADISSGKIPTQFPTRLEQASNTSMAKKSPGQHLKIISNLHNPVCLDTYQSENSIGGWHCHGGKNQRWSFHPKSQEDYTAYWIRNGITGDRCLHVPYNSDGKYYLSKCDSKNPYLLFNITEYGELRSLKTGNCLSNEGHNKYAKEQACLSEQDAKYRNKKFTRQSLYKDDPSLSLIKGTLGKNRQLYMDPSKPLCLDMTEKYHDSYGHYMELYQCNDSDYQKWTFRKKLTERNVDYYQIVNKHSNQCVTSHGQSHTAAVTGCRSTDGIDAQLYFIESGKLRNRHTNACLAAKRIQVQSRIIDGTCVDEYNIEEQIHVFANP